MQRLDPQVLESVCAGIASRTHRVAAHDGEHCYDALRRRYEALQRRRVEIGGMIELARRLDEWRLVRLLEQHKDALTRLIEAD